MARSDSHCSVVSNQAGFDQIVPFDVLVRPQGSPLAFSMYADTADYNEWRTGRRATALTSTTATILPSRHISGCSTGFLAFALSDLPPIREFAILAAVAFVLSMIADFTALPGALWMVFKDKPRDAK